MAKSKKQGRKSSLAQEYVLLLLSVLLPFEIIKNDYRNYQSSLLLVLAYETETVIECHEEL